MAQSLTSARRNAGIISNLGVFHDGSGGQRHGKRRKGDFVALEQTFIMIKPDGVQRSLIGEIISRFECKGLKFIGMKLIEIDEATAKKHYEEHLGKPFYEGLVQYITSGPVLVGVLEGDEAISVVRTIVGATDPKEATPGTIRGDLGMQIGRNVIHASDAPVSAAREIDIYFDGDELLTYRRIDEAWLYEE